MSNELHREELEIDQDELELLKQYVAGEPGLELEVAEEPEPGFAPLLIIGLVGAGTVVAGAVSYLAEVRRGGQVIDLREGHELARRDKGVVYGLVIIVATDGTVKVDVKEPKGYFATVFKDVLEALQGTAAKTVEAALRAATAAAGNRATVTSGPALEN